MMFVGTHKNKKKKKKVEETIGNKRSRVGTNRKWLKMTRIDKEKLRMGKNLVKSNNKKIKKALELLDELVEYTHNQGDNWREPWAKGVIEKIKEILEDKS